MQKDIDYVSVIDPALDIGAMGHDYAKYAETGDASLLRFLPGKTPARFKLRPLDTATYMSIVEPEVGATQATKAFVHGVKNVTNLALQNGNVMPEFPPAEEIHTGDGLPRRLYSAAQVQSIAPGYLIDVGRVVVTMSFLGRSSVGALPVPLTLLRICRALVDRHLAADLEEKSRLLSEIMSRHAATSDELPKSEPDTAATAEAS